MDKFEEKTLSSKTVFQGRIFDITDDEIVLSDGLKRSQKFYLYKKGSVFFCYDREELTALENALQAVPCFRQIGYNHYQTIPTNNV